MAFLATIIRFWQIGLIVAFVATASIAYYLWTVNVDLRTDLRFKEQQNAVLREARVKDAEAASKLLAALKTEQTRLLEQLDQLGGIQDAEGRTYLDTAVPDSIRGLFTP